MVSGDRTATVNHDEGCGDLSSGILAGLMMEVVIEFRNARVEGGTVVRSPELLYPVLKTRRVRHRLATLLRYSRAAFFRTGPGLAGFRMAFANASVSRA